MACVVTSPDIAALLGSRVKEVIIPVTMTDRYMLSFNYTNTLLLNLTYSLRSTGCSVMNVC